MDRWEGFGGSLSWWAVFTADWPEQSRREVYRRLFGRGGDCLGWNIARYNAGGTEPDADPKRFRPGGKVQVILDRDGSFHPERDAGQIGALREAARLGADTFELFVNSPPYWMLRSGRTHGGDRGSENLRPECEEEYARWLVRLTTLLERHARIRFASVEPFNEPSADWWRSDREGGLPHPAAGPGTYPQPLTQRDGQSRTVMAHRMLRRAQSPCGAPDPRAPAGSRRPEAERHRTSERAHLCGMGMAGAIA